jgi:hypothetical protein
MKCPECGILQDHSPMLIPGVVVFRCRPCGTFRIKDDDQVIYGGDGVMDRLRARGHEVLADRRYKEMIESDIEDPRWENWTQ